MSEILNSIGRYTPLTVENMKSDVGITALNNMLRMIFENLPADGEGIGIYRGYGSPENLVTAKVGSLYQRLDGGATTTLYVKTSGSGATGWTGK